MNSFWAALYIGTVGSDILRHYYSRQLRHAAGVEWLAETQVARAGAEVLVVLLRNDSDCIALPPHEQQLSKVLAKSLPLSLFPLHPDV